MTAEGSRRRPRRTVGAIDRSPWRRVVNPFRPVEILSADQIEAIHRASLRILSEIGRRGARRPRRWTCFAADGAAVDRGTRHRPARPGAGRGARRARAQRLHAPRPKPATEHPARWRPPRVLRRRRPGVRDAISTAAGAPATTPTSWTTSGSSAASTSSTRRVGARSSRPTCRSRPAISTCTTRWPRCSTRRGIASGAGRTVVDDAHRGRGDRPRRGPRSARPRAEPDHDHQHELAAPPRRPDVRRADRDGDARPAGRRHAVHAGRRDDAR